MSSHNQAPIAFPETYITEETFERQGWEKIEESGEEEDSSPYYYYMLPIPKDNPSEEAPFLVSCGSDDWKQIKLPKGSYVVELGEMYGLGYCESEEQLEILYRALTGQEIDD